MDNKTRAEKIWDDLENRRMGVTIKGIWVERLRQELDEAQREAEKRGYENGIQDENLYDNIYTHGFSDAIDQAAKFVETDRDGKVGEIKTYYAEDRLLAERIRSLSPKESK